MDEKPNPVAASKPMGLETNPYKSPAEAGQPVPRRWKRPTLIALLLASPLLVLLAYASLGLMPTLVVAIALNFSIRGLKRSQQAINTLPFLLLAMLIAAVYIIGPLRLAR